MNDIRLVIDELRVIAVAVNKISNILGTKIQVSENDTTVVPENNETEEIVCDFSELREKLSKISRAGHTAEVRQLLKKYNAGKLSEVASDDYSKIWFDADKIMSDDASEV